MNNLRVDIENFAISIKRMIKMCYHLLDGFSQFAGTFDGSVVIICFDNLSLLESSL